MSNEPETEDEIARRYHRRQLLLGAGSLLLGALYLSGVLVSGSAVAVDAAARFVSSTVAWRVAVVAVALGAGHRLLLFPVSWVRGYWLPRRHGLLHQPLAGWLGDRLKAALIAASLGLLAVEVIYAAISATPLWWLLAAGVFVVVEVALAMAWPIWLLPLFYRLTPLEDEALRRMLLQLSDRAGIRAVGVWVADQSRKGRTANAALVGIGRTRRILLFDTLVDRFAPDEIAAVLAHELGHHAHHDMWRGLTAQAALTVASLWVADVLLRAGVTMLGLESPADPAGLPWLVLVMAAVGLVAAPALNVLSRRTERRADDFALGLTGNVGAFVGAMERLASLNLAERHPHPVKEALLYSHPSVARRIARATARA